MKNRNALAAGGDDFRARRTRRVARLRELAANKRREAKMLRAANIKMINAVIGHPVPVGQNGVRRPGLNLNMLHRSNIRIAELIEEAEELECRADRVEGIRAVSNGDPGVIVEL